MSFKTRAEAEATRHKHLHPGRSHPSFYLRRILARQLQGQIRLHLPPNATVADIGCGSRPYEPLFGEVNKYIGVDLEEGVGVDFVATAEDLPFDDGTIDCVIATQMLEHVRRPAEVVAEARRVLRPGGLVLMSTHGTIRYHSNPGDYWRWTHEGLGELFDQNGPWDRVDVLPNGGAAVAIGFLLQSELRAMADRIGINAGWRPFGAALNAGIWNAERVYLRLGRASMPLLSPNYLVSATR